MLRRRGVRITLVLVLLAGLTWSAYAFLRPLLADRAAADALKPLLIDGHRIVAVRRDRDTRGEHGRDYRCFADGLCFYAIETFRRLYPAYNDLDDEALIREIRSKAGKP